MSNEPNVAYKPRIIFVYTMCVVGAALLLIERVWRNGQLAREDWLIASASLVVACLVVTAVVVRQKYWH